MTFTNEDRQGRDRLLPTIISGREDVMKKNVRIDRFNKQIKVQRFHGPFQNHSSLSSLAFSLNIDQETFKVLLDGRREAGGAHVSWNG